MRITRVSTVVVNAEMRNWIFVRVDTDSDGLLGWGEATCEWKTRAVAGAVEDLQPLLIGRDPRDIEQLVRVMKKHSFWRLGILGMSAVSGIEIALWDILGKYLNQPVWRLLGGKVRDRVKVYTHLGLGDMRAVYESHDADPIVERALEVIGRGYKALKAVFIPYTHYHALLPNVNRVARIMQQLRTTVGDDIEIMVIFMADRHPSPLRSLISRHWNRVVPCLWKKCFRPATLLLWRASRRKPRWRLHVANDSRTAVNSMSYSVSAQSILPSRISAIAAAFSKRRRLRRWQRLPRSESLRIIHLGDRGRRGAAFRGFDTESRDSGRDGGRRSVVQRGRRRTHPNGRWALADP